MFVTRHLFAAAAISLAVLSGGCSTTRLLHQSPANIRDSLIKRTPVGTRQEDVVTFLKKEGWPASTSTNVPMMGIAGGPMRPLVDYPGIAGHIPDGEVKSTLQAELGSIWIWPLFQKNVEAYWLFGTDNQLLDIWVYKYIEGP
jgi:hypothetical protein